MILDDDHANFTVHSSAETDANADGVIQGLTDTELSNIGYLQSQALGRHLQNHHFSHIYSSDLKRAAEVSFIISLDPIERNNVHSFGLFKRR